MLMVFEANNSNFYDAITYYFDNGTPGSLTSGEQTEISTTAIGTWDTSAVTNMTNAFNNRSGFNENISDWDTSSVTRMMNMFQNATLFNQDISAWDTSSVNYTQGMFNGATSFNQDISS